LAFADNTSGSDEVKSATVHGTEPRTAPQVVWLQFCDLGGFAVGSRDCGHRRLVAHIVALRRMSRSVAIMLQTEPDAMPIVNDL